MISYDRRVVGEAARALKIELNKNGWQTLEAPHLIEWHWNMPLNMSVLRMLRCALLFSVERALSVPRNSEGKHRTAARAW